MSKEKSYAQILKSSSIMGGSAGVNLLLGMVRVKFAAILIGTAGVGLLASFAALQGLIGCIAGLGIASSAVRDVATAAANNDEDAIGRTVLTLRRLSLLTGLVGMVSTFLLSPLLSQLTFGHLDYSVDVAMLGVIIFFANISAGQMALIQGMRRIDLLARANIIGAAIGTVATLGCYTLMGVRGIIPSLVIVAVAQLAISWMFARKLPVPQINISWGHSLRQSGGMLKLGIVMMMNSLLVNATTYLTIYLITKQAGVEAVGIYSAAFALSGIFVNFVLGAMASDYYPRLTGFATNKQEMCRLVNEQTEIGMLLALPGLLGTITLAPWIIKLFYSAEFSGAVELLQLFSLGCAGRIVAWPLGFVMLALGRGKLFLIAETTANLVHLLLVMLGLHFLGLRGVAVAFLTMYVLYTTLVFFISRNLTGFVWSNGAKKIILFYLALLLAGLLVNRMFQGIFAGLIGFTLTSFAAILSVRWLVERVGESNDLVKIIMKIPFVRKFLPAN